MPKYLALIVLLGCYFPSSAKVEFDLGGRVEFDYSYYDDDFTQFVQDDYDVRRLRLGLFTQFNDKLSAYYQTDLSNYDNTKNAVTQAAWVRYKFNSDNALYLGKTEMPFSLESVSNSKYHFFMERSIASALTERFAVGVTYIHYGDDWNLRIGAYGNDKYSLDSSDTYGQALAARIGKKFKPFQGRLYVGASVQYREPETVQSIRVSPESNAANQHLLNTGELFFVDSIEKYGVEALWKTKVWTVQSEYMQNIFNREFGGDLNYEGGYFMLSRIFNGQRRFSFNTGEWKSTKVNNFKTWEISARYSFVDLRSADLNAGQQENISLGVNYYLSQNNRIMFNAIRAKANPNSFGIDETLNIYQLRFQFEF